MKHKLTPTVALIVAGGLATGIALARPASPAPVEHTATTVAPAAGGFLGEDADPDRGFLATPTTAASEPSEPSQVPAPVQIEIVDFGFGDSVTVQPGATVAVVNRDGAPHTVTADDGAFDTDSIAGNALSSFSAPTEPGTYSFFCANHPSMRGELIVQG